MSLSKYDRWKLASPPDYSRAYEEADELFAEGEYWDEFEEALFEYIEDGYDIDSHETEEDYAHARASLEAFTGKWKEFLRMADGLFPAASDTAMEKVIEREGERISENM